MKKYLKATAGALALACAVGTFAGCSNNSTSTVPTSSGGDSAASTESVAHLQANSETESAIGNVATDMPEDVTNIKVDTKIKWLAWWAIDENSPEVTLFKQLYGVPEKKPEGYEDTPDENVFVNINVIYDDRNTRLATMVSSDSAPDCFPFEIGNFPYCVAQQNLFQSVDDLFNFDDDLWANTKDVIENFKWAGHYYCPIVSVGTDELMFYRKSVIEEAGLDDPWELFEQGQWDWDTFLKMCRDFTDPDNGKYAIDGFHFQNSFLYTTGLPRISLVDGKLVGNWNDANFEKAMDIMLLFDDTKETLRYPREIENNWGTNLAAWARNGDILFFEDGKWSLEGTGVGQMKRALKWDEDELQVVPFPQMPGSDVYYQSMKVDPIMLVSGAKNLDGYKAWIYCNAYSAKDPSVKEAFNKQFQESYETPDHIMERIAIIEDPETFSPVFDFTGIGLDIADPQKGDSPLEQLTFYPVMNGTTFTEVRSSVSAQLQTRLDELNAKGEANG